VPLNAVTAGWWSEYTYRKMFGLTHEQYLDEPHEAVGWMIRIDELDQRIRATKQAGE
jgi:hypothetical protein